jgi:hypothetical protein
MQIGSYSWWTVGIPTLRYLALQVWVVCCSRSSPVLARVGLGGLAAEEGGAAVVLVEAVEDRGGVGEGFLVGADHG